MSWESDEEPVAVWGSPPSRNKIKGGIKERRTTMLERTSIRATPKSVEECFGVRTCAHTHKQGEYKQKSEGERRTLIKF